MAKGNKIDIKALTSAIKSRGTGDNVTEQPNETVINTDSEAVEKAVVNVLEAKEEPKTITVQPHAQEEEIKSETDPKESFQEPEPIVSDLKEVVKNVAVTKVTREGIQSFDLNEVINWKRPETTGKKKLVELAKEYDTFFAKVKATTGVSTVKFVNYLVRDFLLKNPDFVQFINEESGRSPQLE